VRRDPAVGLPSRAAVAGRAGLEHAPLTAAWERAQGDCPPGAHARGRAISCVAAAAAMSVAGGASGEERCRGGERPPSGAIRARIAAALPLPRCRLVAREWAHQRWHCRHPSPCSLPSLNARPICNARGSRNVLAVVGSRNNTRKLYQSHLMLTPAGAHCSRASLVSALTSRPGRHSCMGGTKREKDIVVNVAPAGPISGADHQNWPDSSGTQHAHKRLRTSLAQRVARIRANIIFAKPELCKANEGMAHAHARATRTAAPPHHRPRSARRWQRAPRPVPRCPHRQWSRH